MDRNELTTLTADIVAAYVSNNQVDALSLSDVILTVHKALVQTEQPSEFERQLHKSSGSISKPSVPIKTSVSSHSITCLECGIEFKMLKKHLTKAHKLTPNEYRRRWNLDDNYRLVALKYSEKRRTIANNIGLGHMRRSNA